MSLEKSAAYVFPMSFSQHQIWYLQELYPENAAYNIPLAFRVQGELTKTALQSAINALVGRHESFRTTFRVVDGEPSQIVKEDQQIGLVEVDISGGSESELEAKLSLYIRQESAAPFDLAEGPLARVSLICLAENDHVVLLMFHHISLDHLSVLMLGEELAVLYREHLLGIPTELAEPELQYADFTMWQKDTVAEIREAAMEHWRTHLADCEPFLKLATDRPRGALQTFAGAEYRFEFSPELSAQIRGLARGARASLFMTLLAAFKILLYRYTGQEDVTVGCPFSNRAAPELEKVMGCVMNTLPIRNLIDPEASFSDVLAETQKAVMGAFSNQGLPFEIIVEELQPERDASGNPIFQVGFMVQDPPLNLEFEGLVTTTLDVHNGTAKFDLFPWLWEKGGVIGGLVEFNTDLFDVATVARLVGHFEALLGGVAQNPKRAVAEYELVQGVEYETLRHGWNQTAREVDLAPTLVQALECQVVLTPDSRAVVDQYGEIRYRELNARANRLSRYLMSRGVGVGAMVGVCFDRTVDMVVALLGIQKAGAAYLPLDPSFPEDRLLFMVEDAGAAFILTTERVDTELVSGGAEAIVLEGIAGELEKFDDHNPEVEIDPQDIAYVIYTSGSTGKPKGVLVPHKGVVNFLDSMSREPGLGAGDTLVAVTTLSFDISVLELMLPLVVGATVVIAAKDVAVDGVALAKLMVASEADIMQATPATWRMLIAAGWSPHRDFKILCGGEAMPVDLAAELTDRSDQVWNLYGPTETTVWSTVWQVRATDEVVPIGKPIANTTTYVVDSTLKLVPIGVWGELLLGGHGVTRGYHNRPELTAERFVPDPFSETPDQTIYRTGDLARWRSDGVLEFRGRNDDQVKVRGFRIELGEIEHVLNTHAMLSDAAVVIVEVDRVATIAAYVVVREGGEVEPVGLRDHVRQSLPDYMVPGPIMVIDEMPRTPNGKINRRALPEPQFGAGSGALSAGAMPTTESELLIARIWVDLLPVDAVRNDDNFFHLGGHSLVAAKMFALIRDETDANIPLATLFSAPTLGQLAGELDRYLPTEEIEGGADSGESSVSTQQDGNSGQMVVGERGAWSPLVTIQPKGKRTPLYCVHSVGGNVLNYGVLVEPLGYDQPIYGLQAIGLDGLAQPIDNISEMATAYVQELKAVGPAGPYNLCGGSLGGLIALEMARQLRAAGESVPLLALFDTIGPELFDVSGLDESLSTLTKRRLRIIASAGPVKLVRIFLQSMKARLTDSLYRLTVKWCRMVRRPLPYQIRHWLVERVSIGAVGSYKPQVYDGDVTLIRAPVSQEGMYSDPKLGWGAVIGGRLEIVEIPDAVHEELVEDPLLAKALTEALDRSAGR